MSRSLKHRLRYLRSSALKALLSRGYACPSCGDVHSSELDRKWLVTSLRRCLACRLLYRAPTTSVEENESYYQSAYEEGFTTDMPSAPELEALKISRFAGHEKNYDRYIAVLRALGVKDGAKVFDFGCSWGYGSYQLAEAGFRVEAFEISRPRAEYASSKLGVSIRPVTNSEHGAYCVFLSTHVIEHVPSVSDMIELGMRYLKPGGLFIAFTPNGSTTFRTTKFDNWHELWGLVHPQLIDEEYLLHRFCGLPLIVTSSPHPVSQIAQWDRSIRPLIASLEGDELMFAVQKPVANIIGG
jgi:2-polyprenyl-3-methyl-5-hydroxy-6-metoxy-1,4-benzoquinol methylase